MTTTRVLIPWDKREAINLHVAAEAAAVTRETVRLWCTNHHLGRRVGSRW